MPSPSAVGTDLASTPSSEPTPVGTPQPSPATRPPDTAEPVGPFTAGVVIARECFNAARGYAEVRFRISWGGDTPVEHVRTFFDTDEEPGSGSHLGISGSYVREFAVTVGIEHTMVHRFYAERGVPMPEGAGPGRLLAEVETRFTSDPPNLCAGQTPPSPTTTPSPSPGPPPSPSPLT
jgi:hypothetical protein